MEEVTTTEKPNPNPLVSIIVITYNSAKYVLETLESAKAQTYQNIELIITDDASQDDTVEICRSWLEENKERFVRTELVTVNENSGIPANCNRGLYASTGEWIKLIAGDDVLLPQCIELNIESILEKNGLVQFSYQEEFIVENEKKRILKRVPFDSDVAFFEKSAKQQYETLLLGDNIYFTPTSFINRKILIVLEAFDEEFRHIEDYPMWLKLTKNDFKLNFLDRKTVLYRVHSDSIYGSSGHLLVHPSVQKHKAMREKYVYPFITKPYRFDYMFKIKLMQIISLLVRNKKTRFTIFLSRNLCRLLNPAHFYIQLFKPSILK